LTAAGSGLGLLAAADLFAPRAAHADQRSTAAAAPSSDASESAAALEDLRAAIADVEARFHSPAWHMGGPIDFAEARRGVMFHLQHAIEVWFEPSPERPSWHRFVTPTKKLLGDNPDAIYFATPISAKHSYRIRGNTAKATYTSFTVELGATDGGNSTGIGHTLNDTEFEIEKDGSFEIIASATKPAKGNWLRLDPTAGSLSTRHYYETKQCMAADQMLHIPLSIERLDATDPPPPPSDASVAAGIRRVANFLRSTINPPGMDPTKLPPWVSLVPNQFNQPKKDDSNKSVGFAAVDNVYSLAPWKLANDEALVIRGRFPKCRFANLVLWNRYTHTLDYAFRRVSLNRAQTRLEKDGSFKIVIAAQDPGVSNWIETEGRPSGTLFWRFQLPEEAIAPLVTKIVKVSEAAQA
jgi:hypothetical protein